jgi:hypothetical protein
MILSNSVEAEEPAPAVASVRFGSSVASKCETKDYHVAEIQEIEHDFRS